MIHKTERERELELEIRNEQKESQLKWYHYLLSALVVLMGLVFIVYKEINVPFLCRLFACVFAAAGVVSIVSYVVKDVAIGYYRLDLVYGMMAIFIAVLFFTKQDELGEYFPLIAGMILVSSGVIKFQHSIDMKRIDRKMKRVTEAWLVVMIFALMCITAGVVAVYMKPEDSRTLFLFVGISMMVAGASDIFTNLVFNRKVKQFRTGDYEPDITPSPDVPEPSAEAPAEESEPGELPEDVDAADQNA